MKCTYWKKMIIYGSHTPHREEFQPIGAIDSM